MIQVRRVPILAAIALMLAIVSAGPAGAHTGFESSSPSDGAVLDTPVDEISLVFSGEAAPTGDGFEVLDSDGKVRTPSDERSEDGKTWVFAFDPPLAGGRAGVRWMVKAPDAHAIDGAFSFTVTAPAAVPAADQSAAVPAEDDASVDPATSDLDSFLSAEADATAGPERIGALGRVLSLTGTLVGLGALVFAATVLRGDRRDIHCVLYWIRRSGLIVVVGAGIELAAQLSVEAGGSWLGIVTPSIITSVLWSSFGFAVVLRVAGGLALTSGARIQVTHAAEAPDPVGAISELVGVGASTGGRAHLLADAGAGDGPIGDELHSPHSSHAWLATIDSAGAFFGAAALVLAYLFDGHTVTEGDRYFTAVFDVIHIVAGAVWVGGVTMLAAVLWQRHRQGRALNAALLAVRFSVVATIALVAVGLAGAILAVIILDSISGLWSTPWGRLLMAKLAVVGIAAAGGAYNHKVLIPRMTSSPDDPETSSQFRFVVTAEAAALALVVVITAFLVGAAS